MIFRLRSCRFDFRAIDSVYFPPGKAGNVFRGALGAGLRFEDLTPPEPVRPRGLADPPRPFVLRAAHLDGKRILPGETFSLGVNIFDLRNPLIEIFAGAFSEWACTGLGPRRGRVELLRPIPEGVDLTVDLTGGPGVSKCSVLFCTPTELKGNIARDAMPFGVLFARVRDRIGMLRGLYGEGPLTIDFRAQSERAGRVCTIQCGLKYRDISRLSSRTGAVHGIGGVLGSVDYEGDLTEFVPWLRAAWWTGVGRHTVWGNGMIEVAHVG